jgi:type 1 glutamine amidotransferase
MVMNRVAFSCTLAAFVVALAPLAAGCADTQDEPKFPVKKEILEKIKKALPEKAPAKPKQKRKILVFSKTNGFRHGSIPIGAAAIALLGRQTGAFSVVHSEDDSMFEPEKLKEFDAVFMLNTTGDIFKPREMPKDARKKEEVLEREARLKQSLVDFVKSGKGLAGVHSATDTYHGWGAYNDMMGGTFAGHPWHTRVPIKNLSPKHPLNEMFAGKDFDVTDEIYQFRADTARPTDRRMLLALDASKMDVSKGNRKDGQYPVSWVSTYGKGRTFYCSLGHRDEIFYNPVVLKHYLAGLQYVLGDLEADATPTTPKK